MHGTIFALAILAMIGLTLAVLKKFGKRPRPWAVVAGILVMAVTFVVLIFLVVGHACNRGGSLAPVVLGTLSAGIVRATVDRKGYRRLLWIGWFAITNWGVDLCHMNGYVGNPWYDREVAQSLSDELTHARKAILKRSRNHENMNLPQGWVAESWQTITQEEFPGLAEETSATLGRSWHTWFTGIFPLATQHCEIWCPGGSLEKCAQSLEFRPRERKK